jgi:Lon protease-like protein
MAGNARLRLFPLFTVLFPGMRIPLQVFEDRYRTLVAECLSASEPFGIVLIKEGREVGGAAVPHSIGTTAVIESVERLGPERLLVQARGGCRFRIVELYHDRPYLSAQVEYPVDEASEIPQALLDEVRGGSEQLERLRQTMESRYSRSVRLPSSPAELADAIGASATPVLPGERLQPLLEALDLRRRVELAHGLVGELIESTHGRARDVVAQRWASREQRN